MTREKKYEYYLILGTRLIRETKRKQYEEYDLFEWSVMEDQCEVFERRNGIDKSESDDSPYWIGNSNVMDTIETLTEQQADTFMEKYQKAYEKHKSDFFIKMLEKEELDLLKRLDYAIRLEELYVSIKNFEMLPVDCLHGFLLSDISFNKVEGKDYLLANRIMYFIQQFDEIYTECGYEDFHSKLSKLIEEV